jgi:hypothetical protein
MSQLLQKEEATVSPVLDGEDAAFASDLITLLHQIESVNPSIRAVDNELATIIANAGLAIRLVLDELGLGPAI